jgi:hypothetical protein
VARTGRRTRLRKTVVAFIFVSGSVVVIHVRASSGLLSFNRSTRSLPRPEKPVEVRLDRPFLYAIVDTRTQTALFLGRIVDPR